MIKMLNSSFTFSNGLNLVFGLVFGFGLMAMLICIIISHTLRKTNKHKEIREISKKVYEEKFNEKDNMKNKLLSSLAGEVKGVSEIISPDKEHPLYELSINQIINGINVVNRKLKRLVYNPLFTSFRNTSISALLDTEKKYVQPVLKMYNNIFVKVIRRISAIVLPIINLVNPVFYMKKIIKWTAFRQGKKDLIIIGLDFIGNTSYEIYKDLDNDHNSK